MVTIMLMWETVRCGCGDCGYVGGTCGSGIASRAANVLGKSVLRGMRGVRGVYEMYVFDSGRCGR